MRAQLLVLVLAATVLSGCSDTAKEGASSLAETSLAAFGIPIAGPGQGEWSHVQLEGTLDGAVAGFDYTIPTDVAATESVTVTPMIPPGVNVTKYAVMVYGNVSAAMAMAKSGDRPAAAQAAEAAGSVQLLGSYLSTELTGTLQGLPGANGAAATAISKAAIAGPTVIEFIEGVQGEPGQILHIVVALQTELTASANEAVTAVQDGASAATDAATAAGLGVRDQAIILVSMAAEGAMEAYATADEARQAAQATATALAAQGKGRALQAFGTAQGVAIPIFLATQDTATGARQILQSADIEAVVTQSAASLWPAAVEESIRLSTQAPGAGFDLLVGSATTGASELEWSVVGNVHGEAISESARSLGLRAPASLPVPLPMDASGASAVFHMAAGGVDPSELAFDTTLTGGASEAAVTFAGLQLGSSLEDLLGIDAAAMSGAMGTGIGLPAPAPGGLRYDAPVGRVFVALPN